MTHWHGGMGKGARRRVQELKRDQAADRAVVFEGNVERIMREQNVTRGQAYPVACSVQRGAKRIEEVLTERDRRVSDFHDGYSAYVLGEPDPPNASQSYRNGWERARGDEMGDL